MFLVFIAVAFVVTPVFNPLPKVSVATFLPSFLEHPFPMHEQLALELGITDFSLFQNYILEDLGPRCCILKSGFLRSTHEYLPCGFSCALVLSSLLPQKQVWYLAHSRNRIYIYSDGQNACTCHHKFYKYMTSVFFRLLTFTQPSF